MFGISWIDLVILVLASFRLTHLIVYDEITSFLRNPFFTVVYEADATGQMNRQYRFKGGKVRRFFGELLSCHWCTGIWVAVATVAVYAYVPAAYPILLLLAIAGAAAILETRLYM